MVMDESFNPCHLSPEELEKREVFYMDVITSPPIPERDDWKLSEFECEPAGIQRLAAPTRDNNPEAPPEWTETYDGPMMMCAKVIRAHVAFWGLQTRLEKYVTRGIIPGTLLESARAIVGWAPLWSQMTREQIDEYTDECFAAIKNQISMSELKKQRKKEKKERKKAEREQRKAEKAQRKAEKKQRKAEEKRKKTEKDQESSSSDDEEESSA